MVAHNTDPIAAFSAAIIEAGLTAPETIIANGNLHRFSSNGKGGDDAGWYVLHAGEIPAGVFGCWRAGFAHKWSAIRPEKLSKSDAKKLRDKWRAIQRQHRAERARRHAEAAEIADKAWQATKPATADHPYLAAKGVGAYGIHVDEDALLLVPMRNGALHSLQFIDATGQKRCLPGGRVVGCYHSIGKLTDTLYVCEGYATAASTHEATGQAVAVAFNAGNLLPVVKTLREKYPSLDMVLAADNDVRDDGTENTGVAKATEAAKAVNGRLAVPESPGDFNDLHQAEGLDAVRRCLDTAALCRKSEVNGVNSLNEGAKSIDPGQKNSGQRGQDGEVAPPPSGQLPEPEIERPGFCTHDCWFRVGQRALQPGLYWHGENKEGEPTDTWVCSAIHATAMTQDERSKSHGLLLRFVTPRGAWQEWAAPVSMLKGSGEELRGELLDMGMRISPKSRILLTEWLMGRYPEDWITAAIRPGWHGAAFVLPERTIGDTTVRFQSAHTAYDDFVSAGSLADWRVHVAALCTENPVLILAVSVAFAGPLLKLAKLQEVGGAFIHLVGDSSQGKTSALQAAASVWGAPGFVRSWLVTSNGIEATAAGHNDTVLVLDEISSCGPRDIGAIVYCVANGSGKQRAKRTGGARETARWRLMGLSSGERTLAAHMAEGGHRAKAGQEARMLDVPATTRAYGVFDHLHQRENGRAFSDTLKQVTATHYGHAGPAFVEALLNTDQDLPELYANTCALPEFAAVGDGLEGRAAGWFALVGMAGELATDHGVTAWQSGAALTAAIWAYQAWRDYRGRGQTEDRHILQMVREFIERHGDARFSPLHSDSQGVVRDRAGYWRSDPDGRTYLFNTAALREATAGYDLRRVLDALDAAGWIVEHDNGKRSTRITIGGYTARAYAICPDMEAE